MNCPKCKANIDLEDAKPLTFGQSFMAVLKDWRVWVIIVGLTVAFHIASELLGFSHGGASGGVGAVGGLYIGLTMIRRRKCPKCDAVFMLPFKKAVQHES